MIGFVLRRGLQISQRKVRFVGDGREAGSVGFRNRDGWEAPPQLNPNALQPNQGWTDISPLILVRVATTLDGWQQQQQQQHRPPKTRGQRHEATIAFASQPTQLPKGVCRNASPAPKTTLCSCVWSLPPSKPIPLRSFFPPCSIMTTGDWGLRSRGRIESSNPNRLKDHAC
ncbi:hypothetical protein C4D60_Mb04t00470 [Musa balbisiana]|uniref:Uncharacterized protein n=1 Tax=Musa balbisiana TaxID=52838 RepID=A0A4S8K8M0_MUSBA|nr:hypothetical protein C4D60_Mb04t00470 [Musa balbisiana]